MTAWLNLTKKELRLGLPAFLIPIVAFFITVAITAYFGNRAGLTWEIVTGVAIGATGIQALYLVYYLLHSLSAEKKKMHLWLHTRMPAYSLLLSKMVAAMISMGITFLITGTTFVLALNASESIPIEIPWANLLELGLLGGLHIFLFAISFAVWFLFFWMIFLLFSRSLGTFTSIILTFFLFIVLNVVLYGWFTSSGLYEMLTMWGTINLGEILSSFNVITDLETGTEVTTETSAVTVHLGTYVFDAILVLILFFASCWMLDRKVEV